MPQVCEPPRRIISANVASRRLGISQSAFSKHLRRGLIQADYRSDVGSFFNPDRLPEIRRVIEYNRLRNWRYVT